MDNKKYRIRASMNGDERDFIVVGVSKELEARIVFQQQNSPYYLKTIDEFTLDLRRLDVVPISPNILEVVGLAK